MRTLTVDLADRSYPIHIGSGILADRDLYAPHVGDGRVVIITSETVATLYLPDLERIFGEQQCDAVVLPDGETAKTLTTVEDVIGKMLALGCDRQTRIIALGGGVIGDIAGFVASCYQRGVDFIQVPTTLLAQVDSSVGGKTAVNHALGKNMIGAFHQPKCVIADTMTLASLPRRELSAGLAEVAKYGAIRYSEFFAWLENSATSLMAHEPAALSYAIEQSCECKADIVSQDETEQGIRAILNLGHTFGHAIEAHVGYGGWLHGEAVAAGMMLAVSMSQRLGNVDQSVVDRVRNLLIQFDLPTSPPEDMRAEDFHAHMRHDKKVRNGRVNLVLLESLGKAYVTDDYADNVLSETLRDACG